DRIHHQTKRVLKPVSRGGVRDLDAKQTAKRLTPASRLGQLKKMKRENNDYGGMAVTLKNLRNGLQSAVFNGCRCRFLTSSGPRPRSGGRVLTRIGLHFGTSS
ncbi:hypothetical protein Ancab_036273, partial [Ancistrocladus abbreviatus]